jgi:hypothetical protein
LGLIVMDNEPWHSSAVQFRTARLWDFDAMLIAHPAQDRPIRKQHNAPQSAIPEVSL